eukprot:TRINITY_DN8399_c0_g1_i1.p1 TRINITY_DN8399_c0_g1~~TRINITY_DN8399_c0_g1_i1.p1  ORF type:complete len:363 (-),score=159.40 TRINITY_DN8399_c0_g1_i1:184-1272(-)
MDRPAQRNSFTYFSHSTQPSNSNLLPSFRDSFVVQNNNNSVAFNGFPRHIYSESLGNLSDASSQVHSNLMNNDSRSFLSSLSRFPHSTAFNPNASDTSFTSEILNRIKMSNLEGNSVPSHHQMKDNHGRRSSSPASLSHSPNPPNNTESYHPSSSSHSVPSIAPLIEASSQHQNQILSLTPQSLKLQELSDASVAVSMNAQSPTSVAAFSSPSYYKPSYFAPALIENPNTQRKNPNEPNNSNLPNSKKEMDKKRKETSDGFKDKNSSKARTERNKEEKGKSTIKSPPTATNVKKSPQIVQNSSGKKNEKSTNLKNLQSTVEMEIGMDSELPNEDSLKNMLKVYDKFHNNEESKLVRGKRVHR